MTIYMIYFLITTCLKESFNFDIRVSQYKRAISKIIEIAEKIENTKIVIVENNGERSTFLDDFGVPVIYTTNNSIDTKNIGIKEIKDIFHVIEKLKIEEDDFIVKITGRYILEDDSYFIKELRTIEEKGIDCIIKYGWWMDFSEKKIDNCITGIIGMRCKYIKLIEIPDETFHIEIKYAIVANNIPENRVCIIPNSKKIGIHICPGSDEYMYI